ncbi:MAG: imidazole glycerol phosphate synthase subunit HisH [Bacteroidales bacterium]|nr:imidazole glycerol phosphate synthase subunit HisH [Bacteroidales bacterium]
MNIAIIDYGAGNVKSVQFALERIGFSGVLTDDITTIEQADKVIFPGVGEARSAMQALKDKGLDTEIPNLKQDVLGICLGMQLMCDYSEEGGTEGMGIFPGKAKKFPVPLKIPHVGWNQISKLKTELFQQVNEASFGYFVHSFYVPLSEWTVAQTDYSFPFSAALAKDNFYGCQFHPEKSSLVGEQILRNFLAL